MSSKFKVGDEVKVKDSVKTPRYAWGKVSPGEVGVVKKEEDPDGKLRIDFPSQTHWTSPVDEMELVVPPPLYKKIVKPFSEVPEGEVVYRHKYNILCVKLSQNSAARLARNSIGGKCNPKDAEEITHIEGLTYADIYASIKEIAGIEESN